jgi:hypothetical protein
MRDSILSETGQGIVMPLSRARYEWFAVLALCPILLAAALWNGFPIIFYDTGAYVLEGVGHVFLPERSAVYSLFLAAAGARISLWTIAALQALMTSFVLVQTIRLYLSRATLGTAVLIGAALAAATGIDWYVGQIEPDCFTAIVILSFWLLAFGQGLGNVRRAVLIPILAFAVAAHPSHLGLAAGLLVCLGLFKLSPWRRRTPSDLMRPLLAWLAALAIILCCNYAMSGAVFISRSGAVFVFARLMQDGIVKRLLDDTCPQSGYRLCAYKGQLKQRADAWLWGHNSPFRSKLHGFSGTRAEDARIVMDSLKRYPWMHLKAAVKDTAAQFFMFRTGDQIEPQEWVLLAGFDRLLPGQKKAYLAARQQRGLIRFRILNVVNVPIALLSLVGLFFVMARQVQRGRWRELSLSVVILLALVGNAIICATFANPHDRYQSRIIWLPTLVLLLARMHDPKALRPALQEPRESGR